MSMFPPIYVVRFHEKVRTPRRGNSRDTSGDGAALTLAVPTKAARDELIARVHVHRNLGRIRTEKISPTRVIVHATRSLLAHIFGVVS